MTDLDLDEYVGWLRARGVADEHLPLYREGAEQVLREVDDRDGVVRDVHIEAAVQAEAARGGSERRQDNLRTIGAYLRVYLDELREQRAAQERAVDDEPGLELADVPRGTSRRARLARISQSHLAADGEGGSSVRGTMIDDLVQAEEASPGLGQGAMPPRSALASAATPIGRRPSAPAMAVPFTDGPRPGVLASPSRTRRITLEERPLPGCACRTRQEIFADDYWSMWGKVYVFVTGTAGFFLAMLWSRLAGLVVGLAIAAIGAIATGVAAGWRCSECRRWIATRGLDLEQRRNQRSRTLVFVGLGVVLGVVCGFAIQRLRSQQAEERRALRVLDDLEGTDETGD